MQASEAVASQSRSFWRERQRESVCVAAAEAQWWKQLEKGRKRFERRRSHSPTQREREREWTGTPLRGKPHTSTADLLTWSETPLPDSASEASVTPASRSSSRPHQPSASVGTVLFGGQVTPEEAESLLKRKPCSGPKLKEMMGSGIFAGEEDPESLSILSNLNHKPGLRLYQQTLASMSQISFSADGRVSPKKPTTLTEVAKQRELSGSLESEADALIKRQLSDAKSKELSGHDIFAPPPEISRRSLTANSSESKSIDIANATTTGHRGATRVSTAAAAFKTNFKFAVDEEEENLLKTAKKIHNHKFTELAGNNIFKGGDAVLGSAEKSLSTAKLREMSGSDIFADGMAASRYFLGRSSQAPRR